MTPCFGTTIHNALSFEPSDGPCSRWASSVLPGLIGQGSWDENQGMGGMGGGGQGCLHSLLKEYRWWVHDGAIDVVRSLHYIPSTHHHYYYYLPVTNTRHVL